MTPGFSVIIPVYNGAAFVSKAINSCLYQTVLPNEIIVIDDASTDETALAVQSIHSDLVRYQRNTQNSGPSFSRNKGIESAKHEWILFLDADDIFHPQKIEITEQYILTDHSIRAIGHSFDITNNSVENRFTKPFPPVKQLKAGEVLLKNPVVTPALAVKKENAVFFNESMSYAEDHDFILRTVEKYRSVYFDLPLCSLGKKPLSGTGLSSNRWKMRKGEIKMYMDYCKRHGLYIMMPFLAAFSLVKHVRSKIFNPGNR